jgi:hypothetical protein
LTPPTPTIDSKELFGILSSIVLENLLPKEGIVNEICTCKIKLMFRKEVRPPNSYPVALVNPL